MNNTALEVVAKMTPVIEFVTPAVGKALISLGVKSVFGAVKKWRDSKEDSRKADLAAVINDIELSKSVEKRLGERITAALQQLSKKEEDFSYLLAFENDEVLKEELARRIAQNELTSSAVLELWLKSDPNLASETEILKPLSEAFVEAIYKSLAENENVFRVLSLKGDQRIRSDIAAVFDQVKDNKENHLAQQSQLGAILQKLDQMSSGGSPETLRILHDREKELVTVLDQFASQNAKRFERAKEQLLSGTLDKALFGFKELVEDLESQGDRADKMLLFRSYSNLATSHWEQDRPNDAVPFFKKAVALFPDDHRSKRHRVVLCLAEDDNEGALAILRELMKELPNDSGIVCNAAIVLKALGKPLEAMAMLEAKTFEDSDYYGFCATILNDLGRYSEAEDAARKGLTVENDSFSSRVALAAAIAIPIIRARTDGKSLRIWPDEKERVRLLEAASLLEKALDSVKQMNRTLVFRDALANLPPINLLLGQTDKALLYGRELQKIDPEDISVLSNLWCAEMREDHLEEASVIGETLFKLNPSIESWEKKVYPLIQLRRNEEIPNLFEKDSVAFPGLKDSSDSISLVAHAYSGNHLTEKGLQFVNEHIQRFGESAPLIATRAALQEDLNLLTEASQSFQKAKELATSKEKAEIATNAAYFKYRHNDWEGAARDLDELGASSIYAPHFRAFIVSLFNSKQFARCIDLCEDAIENFEHVPDVAYVLAARAHFFGDNFIRAKELLDLAVSKGKAIDFEVRKMLAFAFWHLDEADKAIDLATKAVSEKENDRDLLLLLSVASLRQKRFSDALSYGKRVVTIFPTSIEAHMTLTRAFYMAPSGTVISDEIRQAHLESERFLLSQGGGVYQAIAMDEEHRTLKEIVKERARFVQEIEGDYAKQMLPLGVFARRVGRTEFEVWQGLLWPGKGRPPIKMQTGAGVDQGRQLSATIGTEVAVDLLALYTLQLIGQLSLLPRLYKQIYVHSSALEAVLHEIRQIELNPRQGNLSYSGGQFRLTERTEEEANSLLAFLKPIRDLLKSESVVHIPVFTDSIKDENTNLLLKACGEASFLPILVAREKSCSLFSDDASVREIAHAGYKVSGFCSQALLRLAVSRGELKSRAYQQALLTLIQRNYWFVSEDTETLEAAYYLFNGELNETCKGLIRRIFDPRYNAESCVPILARFAAFLWHNDDSKRVDRNSVWLKEIWASMALAKNNPRLFLQFNAQLAAWCLTRPATYYGLMSWVLENVPYVADRKKAFKALFRITCDSAEAVINAQYGVGPALQDWKDHRRIRKWAPSGVP
jgi:Flp pilus assembly protein TadD/predicted nucleic acid-binding protein